MGSKTAEDRKRLIKMASTMEVGSPERRAILAGLRKKTATPSTTAAEIIKKHGGGKRSGEWTVGLDIPGVGAVYEYRDDGYLILGLSPDNWRDGSKFLAAAAQAKKRFGRLIADLEKAGIKKYKLRDTRHYR